MMSIPDSNIDWNYLHVCVFVCNEIIPRKEGRKNKINKRGLVFLGILGQCECDYIK